MPNWLRSYLRSDSADSSKRLVLWQSAIVLALVCFGIGLSIIYRISAFGDVGSGAVAAFLAVTGPLGILAGVAHRKPDQPGGPDAAV